MGIAPGERGIVGLQLLDAAPGSSATVEVAFAWIDGIPSMTSVGKVTIVPPPAMAFITPAANDEPTRAAMVAGVTGRSLASAEILAAWPRAGRAAGRPFVRPSVQSISSQIWTAGPE